MIVRLSHPWRWHKTRDVLDTTAGDLTDAEASKLVRVGYARDVADLIEPLGGGWVTVQLSDGPRKVQGHDAAIAALREDSGQW